MKLSYKLIPTRPWGVSNFNIGDIAPVSITLLIIANLHINKKISDERMKAMVRLLAQGKLLRKVNTYHCKINDQWYNDESMSNILIEVYNDECCPKTDIKLEDFLLYVSLFLSKKRNYCIDWVFYNYINPLLNACYNERVIELLSSFDLPAEEITLLTYEEADRMYDLSSGYCCKDCDGCLGQYKSYRYKDLIGRDFEKRARETFINNLNKYKTKDYLKNPNVLK